jgi:hypothetical protein
MRTACCRPLRAVFSGSPELCIGRAAVVSQRMWAPSARPLRRLRTSRRPSDSAPTLAQPRLPLLLRPSRARTTLLWTRRSLITCPRPCRLRLLLRLLLRRQLPRDRSNRPAEAAVAQDSRALREQAPARARRLRTPCQTLRRPMRYASRWPPTCPNGRRRHPRLLLLPRRALPHCRLALASSRRPRSAELPVHGACWVSSMHGKLHSRRRRREVWSAKFAQRIDRQLTNAFLLWKQTLITRTRNAARGLSN